MSRLDYVETIDNQEEQLLLEDQQLVPPLKLNESWAGRRLIEALSHLPPNNFGASFDMRFQQKQLQEREQRRIEMTSTEDSNETTVDSKNIGNGKVRQMFDERRRGAGIDRSNPLKPISTAKSAAPSGNSGGTSPSASLRSKHSTQSVVATRRPANGRPSMPRSETFGPGITNGNVSLRTTHSLRNEIMKEFPKEFSSLSLGGDAEDRHNNNDAYARAKSSNSIKLNPVVTKKSPSVVKPRPAARQVTPVEGGTASNSTRLSAGRTISNNNNNKVATLKPARAAISTVKTPPKRIAGKIINKSSTSMSVKPPPRLVTPPPGMATCQYCQRNFNEDRLSKHEAVCQKMANTRRKIFDAARHRVQGTEAEKYLKKSRPGQPAAQSRSKPSYSSSAAAAGLTPENSALKKNNWRKKHEEFIAAIRAAKQVQTHLARGGKLADLPPPPPSENADYIQCPHCLRRFNEGAAQRHIPKCATMLHNKPKPGAASQKKR